MKIVLAVDGSKFSEAAVAALCSHRVRARILRGIQRSDRDGARCPAGRPCASQADPSRPKASAEVSRRQAGCGVSRRTQCRRGNASSHLGTREDSDKVPCIGLETIHNEYTGEGTSLEISSPFDFPKPETSKRLQFPPLLNVPASELRPLLFEQYLFALFYGIFYQSFMAENHERLRHMDGALNKLRDDEERLRRASNTLRQKTITEELEIIMLSVETDIMRPNR